MREHSHARDSYCEDSDLLSNNLPHERLFFIFAHSAPTFHTTPRHRHKKRAALSGQLILHENSSRSLLNTLVVLAGAGINADLVAGVDE